MTTPLNFFIRPLSTEMQARTLVSHVRRGIALYLTTGKHPLELACTLSIYKHVNFYARNAEELAISTASARALLGIAWIHWPLGGDFDLRYVGNLLSRLPACDHENHIEAINMIASHLPELVFPTNKVIFMNHSDAIPPDVFNRLTTSIADLETALINKDAMMPQHLRNTHSILISYPECVELLDDAEIARIIDAAEVHTKTEIVKAVTRGKASGAKTKVSVSDL